MTDRSLGAPPPGMHEARFWHREGERLICTLCPHGCRLGEGQIGACAVRKNVSGILLTLSYGHAPSLCVDPVEKKPLYHFLPGSQILSIGTVGCNLNCRCCQNWDLSLASDADRGPLLGPASLALLAEKERCASVAFTYNEPTVNAEYVLDAAHACREAGLGTVMVTNGFISPEAIDEIYPLIDAANVDLKAFDDGFYRKQTGGRLVPVLDAIVRMRGHGTFVELTTLLIPGLNDDDEQIAREIDWILEKLGPDVPLHFSAFHPDHRLRDRPSTPLETLLRARERALGRGLRFVYCGNLYDEETSTTRCPSCHAAIIRRGGFAVLENKLAATGACACGERIPGVFDGRSRFRSDGRRRALLVCP